MAEYAALSDAEQSAIEAEIGSELHAIERSGQIAVIRERANRFRASTYPALLARATSPALSPGVAGEERSGFSDGGGAPLTPPRRTEYVPAAGLRVTFAKPYLADERDVDAYLESLRKTLITEIRSGKRITV